MGSAFHVKHGSAEGGTVPGEPPLGATFPMGWRASGDAGAPGGDGDANRNWNLVSGRAGSTFHVEHGHRLRNGSGSALRWTFHVEHASDLWDDRATCYSEPSV